MSGMYGRKREGVRAGVVVKRDGRCCLGTGKYPKDPTSSRYLKTYLPSRLAPKHHSLVRYLLPDL